MLTARTYIKCPHCAAQFRAEDTLWVANRNSECRDARVPNEPIRFSPRHFTPDAHALDAENRECEAVACPHCHLQFDQEYLETQPFMLTLAGGRRTGKTFFLTAMVWWMKRSLQNYGLELHESCSELCTEWARMIELLFPTRATGPAIKKLEYSCDATIAKSVFIPDSKMDTYDQNAPPGDHPVVLWTPALYFINRTDDISRKYAICLYDQYELDLPAGTEFPPRTISGSISLGDALFFFYDPVQNFHFMQSPLLTARQADAFNTQDDMNDTTILDDPITVFNDMAKRIRAEYRNETGQRLSAMEKYDRPLVIVVTKCDVWKSLLPDTIQAHLNDDPVLSTGKKLSLDSRILQDVSDAILALFAEYAPEFLNVVSAFATDVLFLPVSVTGVNCSVPDSDLGDENANLSRAGASPVWVGVPLLYAMARHESPIITMR
ncbi:MAG: hypothetical protein Q4G68_08455 [Planctomycetia bacterium]|nr:hypothetical protein [Planctomycetia bacterium]